MQNLSNIQHFWIPACAGMTPFFAFSPKLLEDDQPWTVNRGRSPRFEVLIYKFAGGPVGLDTLAAALGEEPDTLESVVEPYLLQEGFVQRTPRGRIATLRAICELNFAAGRVHDHTTSGH